LKPRAITRDLEWGIPAPFPGAEGKSIYVWFEAVIGYFSASKEWAQSNGDATAWEPFWSGDAKSFYFIGKDNIEFHCIIFPAMLNAEGSFILPESEKQSSSKAPGLSPAEVERLVTYPIELQLTGVPSLTEMRSLTKVGLSLVTIVFDDSMDISLARQLVLERLLEVEELLPPGAKPMLVPNSTGLGEVFQYYLDGPHGPVVDESEEHRRLIDQRTVQDDQGPC
jgi:hypothetical protein